MNKKIYGYHCLHYLDRLDRCFFSAGDKEGAKFHLNQALVILIGQIVAAVINYIPYVGGIVGTILSIFLFVCWIMGLIYACQEQEKEVPLIGQIKILNNKMTIVNKTNAPCSYMLGSFYGCAWQRTFL